MTSASELFTARRARAPRLSDPADPGQDPLADAPQDPHGLAARRHRRGYRARCQLDSAGDMRQHLHTGPPHAFRKTSALNSASTAKPREHMDMKLRRRRR
ncbi:uncharacterized protein LOC125507073 isoform X3 [Triticum urartu]|uniref:uncharacterized protein LOC125507073 isoform X3 n=1 Tax=Triticum urartu TaxID=4572 RepID=UPI002043BE48|nr:uncharacterized protein LOC125507073 isoform X3 [Triticum urartu]